MKNLFVTPLLATQRKKTKVAGETAQPKDAEVINAKKEKGGISMTMIEKVDKKIKEKCPRFYEVWSLFIYPNGNTLGVLLGIGLLGLVVSFIICLIKLIILAIWSI